MGSKRRGAKPDAPRKNHVISRKAIREFCETHQDDGSAPAALYAWLRDVEGECWLKWADVKAMYPHADKVGDLVVFNVGGNKYRVICEIHFDGALVLIRHVLTHAEYDRGRWKT